MNDFDPFSASRELARLAPRYRAALRQLALGQDAADPFLGQTFPGKALRDRILSLNSGEPLRDPLLQWTDFLLEGRLNFEVLRAECFARCGRLHPPLPPLAEPATIEELERRILSAAALPSGGAEARALAFVFVKKCSELGAVRRQRFERRNEIAERLGDELHDSVVLFQAGKRVSRSQLSRIAREVLSATDDAASHLIAPGWVGLLQAELAVAASEGWPARLSPETLLELLGGDWLVRGLAMERASLPSRLCPASFLVGARRLGTAVGRATRPRDLPFVVSHRPVELEGRVLGEILATWMTSDSFLRKKLQLSGDVARSAQSALGTSLIAMARTRACKVLLLEAAEQGTEQLHRCSEEVESLLCNEPLGPPLGLLSVEPQAPADLCAFLLALDQECVLRESHDEDWPLNPRAQDQIRSELPRPSSPEVAVEDLERGLGELGRRIPRDGGHRPLEG